MWVGEMVVMIIKCDDKRVKGYNKTDLFHLYNEKKKMYSR